MSFARLELGPLFEVTSQEQANMSLYYFLLHFWLRVGESEFAIRALSAVFAILTVPVVYALGRRLFDPPIGLIAALLVAVNAFVVEHAQEARGYSLALFLATLATYLFVRALEQGRWPLWIAYGIVAGLSAYAHFFCGFVVAAHVTTLFVVRKDVEWRRAAAGLGLAVTLGIPLVLFVIFRSAGQINWIAEPSLADLPAALADLSGGGVALGGVYLALTVYALTRPRLGRASAIKDRTWRWLLVAWFLLPTGLSFALSYSKPMFLSKYLIVALPPLILLAAKGVHDVARPLAQVIFGGAVVTLGVVGLVQWYSQVSREPWREVARYVVENARSGDTAILYSSRIWNPFNYYVGRLSRGEERAPLLVYPDTGWGTAIPDKRGPNLRSVARAAANAQRVWLVLGYADGNRKQTAAALDAVLERDFDKDDRARFRRIRVVLYD